MQTSLWPFISLGYISKNEIAVSKDMNSLNFCYAGHPILGNLGDDSGHLRKDLAWEQGTGYSVPLAGDWAALGTKE